MKFEKEKIVVFYKRLILLYPQSFRTRFGESMEQTFNDVCNERLAQTKTLSVGFIGSLFIETLWGVIKETIFNLKRGITMENIVAKQKEAAITGLVLALPLMLTLLIVLFNIEPLNHYLRIGMTVNSEDGFHLSTFGKMFFITSILLIPIGFVVSLTPLVKGVRHGKLMRINPFSLLVTTMLLIFTGCLFVGFLNEQYSCWKGVCD